MSREVVKAVEVKAKEEGKAVKEVKARGEVVINNEVREDEPTSFERFAYLASLPLD
ncbi:hypothetical protein [Vulcanisaeta sp. JCM 16159]|uniref:hypothetical protein n=1 Tax=Vulcanisaeta sp. JCM 16159 TaxID=1295371 RepID=UPI000AEC79CE|nr:hypothetical protein [Vulcanisaeta sp. JCM 16159]